MKLLRERLEDVEVLLRLNAFLISYLGWMFFGVAYGLLGRWSVDLTGELLKLPLTSESSILTILEFTKSIAPLHALFNGVYYLGFTGSIAFAVAYLLLYLRDLDASDQLMVAYLASYTLAGTFYLVFHVYAPHVVYNIPGYLTESTLLTRQEFVCPSLHNAIAAINILTFWKYRERRVAKALIGINTLIPFATVFLAHHWVYDVLTGFLLGFGAVKIAERYSRSMSWKFYSYEISYLKRITLFNLILGIIVLVVAINSDFLTEILTRLSIVGG